MQEYLWHFDIAGRGTHDQVPSSCYGGHQRSVLATVSVSEKIPPPLSILWVHAMPHHVLDDEGTHDKPIERAYGGNILQALNYVHGT